MPADASYDERLRAAAFAHLDRLRTRSPNGALRSADINSFLFEDRTQRLIVQTGIWKPAGLDAALSIRTTYTPPTEARPYEDEIGDDGSSATSTGAPIPITLTTGRYARRCAHKPH